MGQASMNRHVGQVVNLRRIGNPPAAIWMVLPPARPGWLAAASRRRINNPPQVNNLPHKGEDR